MSSDNQSKTDAPGGNCARRISCSSRAQCRAAAPLCLTALLLAGLLLVSACRHKVDGDVVAKAYDSYLRMGDLRNLVPAGLSPEDSAAVVQNYISQWIQQQVVLHKAKKNVSDDFQQQLDDYKNNLITYEYERLVIEQLLDTNVSDEEIRQYYGQHPDDFILKTNIVRAIYVKVAKDASCASRLRKLLDRAEMTDQDLLEAQRLASEYGQGSNFDEEKWMPFQTLQSITPISTYNEVSFLHDNKFIAVSDEQSSYFINILEYKTIDQTSPLEYEYGHIRTILLNSRKIDIIKKMQLDLVRKAEMDKEIERYK